MSDLTARIQRYADDLIASYPDVIADEVLTARMRPARFHPILVAAAAALVVLLVIGGFAVLMNRSDRPVVEPVTTTLPATTVTTAQPTTTQPPTTTTEAAVPLPVITWTRIDDPVFDGPTDQSGVSVRHIGSAFYIVGNDLDNKSGVIWRSEDGTTWERFDDPDVFGGPPGLHEISDIAGNDSVIVALGWEGNEALLDLGDRDHPPYGNSEAWWCQGVVWVSEDDGHTWTRLSHEEAFGTADSFCEAGAVISTPDGFLAAYHGIWTSQDGLHWAEAAVLSDDGIISDLAITPSGFVGVGQSWIIAEQAAAWWSTDSTNWTSVSNEDGQFDVSADIQSFLDGVASTGNGLVAVGTARQDPGTSLNAAVWLSGNNGRTWRRVPREQLRGFHQEVMRGVTTIGDLLVAVGESSNYPGYWPQPSRDDRSIGVVWVSQDGGATWDRMDAPNHVFGAFVSDWVSIRTVTSFGNQLVAAGYDGKGMAVWVGTIEEGEGQ
jgi:hypothetical protein